MDSEIKAKVEEASKLLHDFQDEHKKLVDEGKSNSEMLVKMQEDFGTISETVQNMNAAVEAEVKAREELEIAVARAKEVVGPDGEIKSDPEYKKGFNNFCRKRAGIEDEAIDNEIKNMILATSGMEVNDNQLMVIKTMLVGSNPDGGYQVPVQRLVETSKRIFESSPIRQLAEVITISTEAVEIVLDDDELASEKVGEMDTRGNTATPQIGLVTIPTHEQQATPVVTQKLLDDAIWNVEAWLTNKGADKFARTENEEFINGTGAHEAQGIMSLADWTTLGAYERDALETRYITGGVLAGDDFVDVQSDLLEGYQSGAVWLMHRKIWAEVMKLKDANNQYLLNPQMLFTGSAPQLLGQPVKFAGDMANALTAGEYIAAYGDFRAGYLVVDRIGIRVLRDPYSAHGFVQFYMTKRTGGGVKNYQAIKRLGVPSET